jgi:hypothetical protein
MIFKYNHLLGIRSGTISLAFRRWEKVMVKPGGTIRNEIGVIRIDSVQCIHEDAISTADAKEAGYDTVVSLRKDLDRFPKGSVYRISLHYETADPRIALREKTSLSAKELLKIKTKLDRLDKTSGPWVGKTLNLIRRYPERRAGDLADILKTDLPDFKLNVRKLKNLGLTISHGTGYSISPLGSYVMEKLFAPDT